MTELMMYYSQGFTTINLTFSVIQMTQLLARKQVKVELFKNLLIKIKNII